VQVLAFAQSPPFGILMPNNPRIGNAPLFVKPCKAFKSLLFYFSSLVFLSIHWVVQNTSKTISFLIHAGNVYTFFLFSFLVRFLWYVQGTRYRYL